jgi:hypothetical protein
MKAFDITHEVRNCSYRESIVWDDSVNCRYEVCHDAQIAKMYYLLACLLSLSVTPSIQCIPVQSMYLSSPTSAPPFPQKEYSNTQKSSETKKTPSCSHARPIYDHHHHRSSYYLHKKQPIHPLSFHSIHPSYHAALSYPVPQTELTVRSFQKGGKKAKKNQITKD